MKLTVSALLFILLFSVVGVKAQQTHFIYIQTSDKQPFYIKLGKNIYSSSYSGYLILSKLPDSTYSFSVGFPKSEWPLQNFSCTVDDKDKGYLLKNFGDKGWGLFNLQTMEITMAAGPVENKNIVTTERTDSFSNMLSAVVNDPGIKRTTTIKKEEVAVDTSQPVQKTDIAVAEEPVKKQKNNPATKPTIIKLLENLNAGGTQLVYVDESGGNKDTIGIFIPVDKETASTEQDIDMQKSEVKTEPEPIKEQPKVEDAKANDTPVVAPKANVDTTTKVPVTEIICVKPPKKNVEPIQKPVAVITPDSTKQNVTVTNTDCKNVASEEDFLKLRKKMASEENDDKMISLANKVFKTKCFTTSQVRNLSFLFLTDEGKYKFFDMAYSFVSDINNYSTLQSELTDAYYVNRFKAMINH